MVMKMKRSIWGHPRHADRVEANAQQFRHWGIYLGGVWSEKVEGTNAIGTSISELRAVTVHGAQHFRARHISLSCSSAPILDAHVQGPGCLLF